MSIRMLVLGAVVLGAAGQWACSTQADAAQLATTEGESERGPSTPPPEEGQACGGFAGFQCPEGQSCVDDPNDDCDPTQGGADCIGICTSADAERKKPKCHRPDPTLSYVSRDPEQCLAILFVCPEGSTQFFNECGCGCRTLDRTCDYTDPTRRYVATSPEQCATIRFTCEPGEEIFSDACGCGCQTVAP
ncbi:MAG TPA: hypothetical protein VF815_44020 [Myxococcaceae bacterium]|jgi:hypothetical protein